MEQYDYIEEVYDKPKKKRGPIRWALYILLLSVIIGVTGLVLFRIFTQHYWPQEMKSLLFNDTLTAHYEEMDGDIQVYTQDLRTPYDSASEGNFFADGLRLIPAAGQLQITLRYNGGRLAALQEKYGTELLPDDNAFIFKLESSRGETYELAAEARDEAFMYRYRKLVFDGVTIPLPHEIEILRDEAGNPYGSLYMTVNVYLEGLEEPIARIPVYETHLQAKNKDGIVELYEYEVERYN